MSSFKVSDILRKGGRLPAIRAALRRGYVAARRVVLLPREIHSDDRGAISVLSVFALLVFTFLLVMVVNVATHLDDKVRMQNTADAAAHSSGVVLSRGMNAITFSNHLLCDIFALTAFLRESRDRQGEAFVPEILDEWENAAQRYSSAEFEKYQRLGSALSEKIPLERELSSAFGELNAAAAEFALPVMESVLEQKLIPQFQYTVTRDTPELAQKAAFEVAVQNGLKPSQLASYPNVPATTPNGRSKQTAVLWHLRDDLGSFTDENDPNLRNMPVVDPTPGNTDYPSLQNPEEYFGQALTQRQEISKFYLEAWISDKMTVFDQEANLSQHNWLFRIFAAGQLDKLLKEDYPDTNIPMLTRLPRPQIPLLDLQRQGMTADVNQHIDDDYHFLVVIYRDHVKDAGPGLFRNPLKPNSDAMAFSQFRMFLPRPRWWYGTQPPPRPQGLGGSFGFASQIPPPQQQNPQPITYLDNWPTHHWDVFNQNWTIQLVPATSEIILPILQTKPTPCQCEFKPPQLNNVTMPMIRQINTH
ncbi:MAG: Tad domain-containing protein [Planctomycetaceae bacterium]|nr:Tad domain-containing protein [Planctomycetaceae bacterium]